MILQLGHWRSTASLGASGPSALRPATSDGKEVCLECHRLPSTLSSVSYGLLTAAGTSSLEEGTSVFSEPVLWYPKATGPVVTGTAASVDQILEYVLSGRSLLSLYDVELHPITFAQALEVVTLDRGEVHEAVPRVVLGGDEPEALTVVEPLHGAGGTHDTVPSLLCSCSRGAVSPYLSIHQSPAGQEKDPGEAPRSFPAPVSGSAGPFSPVET